MVAPGRGTGASRVSLARAGGVRGVLDERDDPAGHEPRGPHHRARPGDLVHLDHAAHGAHLDPPPGTGGADLVGSGPLPAVTHNLDAVTLHDTLHRMSRRPSQDIPRRHSGKLRLAEPNGSRQPWNAPRHPWRNSRPWSCRKLRWPASRGTTAARRPPVRSVFY